MQCPKVMELVSIPPMEQMRHRFLAKEGGEVASEAEQGGDQEGDQEGKAMKLEILGQALLVS